MKNNYEEFKKLCEDNKKLIDEMQKNFQEAFPDMPKMPMMPPFGMPMFPMFPMFPMWGMSMMKQNPMMNMMKTAFDKISEKNGEKVMNIPKELLQKLLKIDSTPKDLEKLQKLLDFIFKLYEEKF